MDSFQVTLPSNASGKTFPNNRPAHYETDLMSPLHLEGPWEVALIDVMYPHAWNNLSKTLKVGIEFGEIEEAYVTRITGEFEIKPQYFATPDIFCQRMNRWCKTVLDDGKNKLGYRADQEVIRFTYDEVDDRITISTGLFAYDTRRIYICCDDREAMERMLGFDADAKKTFKDRGEMDAIPLQKSKSLIAKRPPAFEAFPLMFVYTNLIEYQLIGDVKAPILAVLPVAGKAGEQVYWNCNPQSFIPVAKSEIHTVEIRLCTETGETFPIIGNGKVITRLNFRRRLV